METLNQYAANLVFHIQELSAKTIKEPRENSASHIPSVDWTNKVLSVNSNECELHQDGSIAKIFRKTGDQYLGFTDEKYPAFMKFINDIAAHSSFSSTASHSFILNNTFDWLIDSYQKSRISLDLLPFLEKVMEEKKETRVFHFPVLNLIIDEPFQIGSCTFQFFTEEYFLKFYKNQDIKDRKHSVEFFRRFVGRVFISCTSCAEPKRAEELAFDKASMAMDVLRLFSPAVFIPTKIFLVDLERRINVNYSSDHFSERFPQPEGEARINIGLQSQNDHFNYSSELLSLSMENGLAEFSEFIKQTANDELYKLIHHSISFYSFALSNPDLHLRISHLIMITEGLMLEEGFVKGMQKTTKMRFSRLFLSDSHQVTMLNAMLDSMYEVRHAITHKGIRKPIDTDMFAFFQTTLTELIRQLIKLNNTLKTKDDLVLYMDSLPNR